MPNFRVLVDGDDVSRFCDADTVYCLKRNRDFSLIVPGLNIYMSQDSTTVPEKGDIVLIYYATDIIFYGFIDNVKDANDGTDYDIKIIHYLEKLKDYKIDHDTLHTALAAGTSAQYGTSFFGIYYVQATWLVECLMNLISTPYSVTMNGVSEYIFPGIKFEEIYFYEQMLYSMGQNQAARYDVWNNEDDENYYEYQDNKISAFTLLSELTSIFKIYIYFWNDFVVDIESNLDQYSFHKSLRWKRESRDYNAPNNNVNVKVSFKKDLEAYSDPDFTDLDQYNFLGDDITYRNIKNKSLINNMGIFINLKSNGLQINGGFETWLSGVPEGWTTGGVNVFQETNPTYVHGGTSSVKLHNTTGGSFAYIYQVINLDYVGIFGLIHFWRWCTWGNSLIVNIEGWKNGVWVEIYNQATGTYSGWVKESINFEIPQDITRIKIKFINQIAPPVHTITYIDDFEIFIVESLLKEYAVSLMDVYARDYTVLDVETEIDTVIRRAQEIGFDVAEQKKVIMLDGPEGDALGFPYTLPLEFET